MIRLGVIALSEEMYNVKNLHSRTLPSPNLGDHMKRELRSLSEIANLGGGNEFKKMDICINILIWGVCNRLGRATFLSLIANHP